MSTLALRDVLAIPGLGLSMIGADHSRDAEVRWAHVSELVDPSPWMLGGEFLLTTGVNLPTAADACRDYCARLVNAGIVALGFSFGPLLAHEVVPQSLRAGAEAAGLTLVGVPENTLLQSVVHAVADLIHERAENPVRKVLGTVRKLNESATVPDGINRTVALLSEEVGIDAVVYNEWLRPVAAANALIHEQFDPLRGRFRKQLARGMRWSMTTDDGVASMIALPLGIEGRLRGILAVRKTGQFDTSDRLVIGTAVSLCSVLMELRAAHRAPERAARARLLDDLLSGELSAPEAASNLARAGLRADSFAVLVSTCDADREPLPSVVAAASDHASDLLMSADTQPAVVILCDPHHIQEMLADLELPRPHRVGVSGVVGVDSLAVGFRQACFALDVATSRGEVSAWHSSLLGYRTLLTVGDSALRASFVNEVLGVLGKPDRQGKQELLDTLAAYCRCGGRLEEAAEQLGVHRHTMRARIRRISELTGRSLEGGQDLFELWLAIELRGLGEPPVHPGRGHASERDSGA